MITGNLRLFTANTFTVIDFVREECTFLISKGFLSSHKSTFSIMKRDCKFKYIRRRFIFQVSGTMPRTCYRNASVHHSEYIDVRLSERELNHLLMQGNMESLQEADLDPLSFRPNPEALVSKINDANGAQDGSAGVYRPPMLNPVAMEEDPDKDPNRRKRRAAEDKVRKSSRSQLISDLAREFADAPDEVRSYIFCTSSCTGSNFLYWIFSILKDI